MKKVILLVMLLELWHNAPAQTHAGGAEQYYYMGERQAFIFVPIIYFETGKNWYIEGRYNFEEIKTTSLYIGRTFEKKAAVSYAVSPVIGVVAGRFNGGSAGFNSEADFKKYFFSSQFQYTFSVEDNTENFLYSWSDFSYQASNNIFAGFSVQQTNLYKEPFKIEKGIFAKVLFNKFSIPLYVFSPAAKERYFVLGLNCNW